MPDKVQSVQVDVYTSDMSCQTGCLLCVQVNVLLRNRFWANAIQYLLGAESESKHFSTSLCPVALRQDMRYDLHAPACHVICLYQMMQSSAADCKV